MTMAIQLEMRQLTVREISQTVKDWAKVAEIEEVGGSVALFDYDGQFGTGKTQFRVLGIYNGPGRGWVCGKHFGEMPAGTTYETALMWLVEYVCKVCNGEEID